MPETCFKYHGLGNDFVVLDRRASAQDISPELSRALCDRHRGIGADGVLVLLPVADGSAAAEMVVHNADGSIAQMCGNGLRCAVKHVVDHAEGLEKPTRLRVKTGAGILESALHFEAGKVSEVTVDMGPAFLSAPILPQGGNFVDAAIPGFPGLRGTAVSMGNPHLVLLGQPLTDAAVLGPKLEHAEGFSDRTNVEFVQLLPEGLDVVVWERGVGLTQACGTGACAALATAVHLGHLRADTFYPVRLPGGLLQISVQRGLGKVLMRGPAAHVFDAVMQ